MAGRLAQPNGARCDEAKRSEVGKRPAPRKSCATTLAPDRLDFDMRTVVTGRAFIALESPVGAVDRMFGHPFCDADLALDHAALQGDVAF